MGLFDLFSSSSSNKFNVGDFVRVKLTGEEGHIVTAFDDNTYEVELNETGSRRHYQEYELEKMW